MSTLILNWTKVLAMCACVTCCACASGLQGSTLGATDVAITPVGKMAPPVAPIEFLRSLKLAVENGAFYDEETYSSPQRVKQIFSGRIIRHQESEGQIRGVYISDFPASIDPQQTGKIIGGQEFFQKSLAIDAEQYYGRVIVRVSYTKAMDISLSNIQKLFSQKGSHFSPPNFEPLSGGPFRIPDYIRFEMRVPTVQESYFVAEFDQYEVLVAITIYIYKEQS